MKPFLRHKILVFALLTAVLTDVGLLIFLVPDGIGADFFAFWRAANSPHPYALSATPFGNPPTALILLQALRILPFWPTFAVFTFGGILAFSWFARNLYGRTAALLGLLSPAAILAAVPGQLSIIEGALIFAAFGSSPIACGVLLAVAASLKPQMVLLAPVALYGAKGRRSCLAFVLAAVLLTIVATGLFGPAIWSEWVRGVQMLVAAAGERHALLLAVSPFSFAGSVNRIVIAGAVIIAFLCAAGLYALRNLPAGEQAAALVAFSLLASPYALSYDMVALAPFAAAVVLRDRAWRGLFGAITYTAALGPLCLISALLSAYRPSKASSPIERQGSRGRQFG
jgi:hypothetical protein